MSFSSLNYYYFLSLFTVIYFFAQLKYRSYILLAGSYFFYMSFDPRYIFFILITTVVSYSVSIIITDPIYSKYRYRAFIFALSVEFILLFFTKYWESIASALNMSNPIHLLAPLGISFYTFQTVGYLFDVYRKKILPERNFLNYALFLSFFPHLVSGPIESSQSFLPQIQKPKIFDTKNLAYGMLLILIGLFKKFVIADRISHIVNLVFDETSTQTGSAVGLALFLSRYQIYCDFSGYTDIALGSAQILGFKLMQNFNRPFFATSIAEYWQRWHISLAQWIRNYIFYPLVSTSFSCLGVHGLVIFTFLILGLWHGGTTNFLIYGLWHGVFVVLDSSTKEKRHIFYKFIGANKFPFLLRTISILGTFFLIVVPPTIFFRAETFKIAKRLILRLADHWSLADLNFIFQNNFLSYSLEIGLISIVLLEIGSYLSVKYSFNDLMWNNSKWIFNLSLIAMLIVILFFGFFQENSKFVYMVF